MNVQESALELPSEVLLSCLSYLSASDLLQCQGVSHAWSAVAHDGSLWRALLDRYARSSPFVSSDRDHALEPHDGRWQRAYVGLTRMINNNPEGCSAPPSTTPSGGTNNVGSLICPFCEEGMQSPVEREREQTPVGHTRKVLVCCVACTLFVWTNGCEHCGQAGSLIRCSLCNDDVCARCFGGWADKRCEQCGVNGCQWCVIHKSTLAQTKRQCGSKKKQKKKKLQQQKMQAIPTSTPTTTPAIGKKQYYLCNYCGVTCATCERRFDSEDTAFCVACENSVCYSCACPCGALDMF